MLAPAIIPVEAGKKTENNVIQDSLPLKSGCIFVINVVQLYPVKAYCATFTGRINVPIKQENKEPTNKNNKNCVQKIKIANALSNVSCKVVNREEQV